MTKFKRIVSIHVTAFVLLLSCKTTNNMENVKAKEQTSAETKIGEFNPSLSLADYFKRQAGVTVRGSTGNPVVRVRVSGSFNSSGAPLYVVNGSRTGNDYNVLNAMVDVNDIKYIQVLKSTSELVDYGLQGAHGVILITTKNK